MSRLDRPPVVPLRVPADGGPAVQRAMAVPTRPIPSGAGPLTEGGGHGQAPAAAPVSASRPGPAVQRTATSPVVPAADDPVRGLTPARALAPALTPAAPPAARPASPVAVPLRRPAPANRPGPQGAGPAVQRATAVRGTPAGRAVPLLSASKPPSGPVPSAGAPPTAPQAPSRPAALRAPAVVQRHAITPTPPGPSKAPGTAVAPASAPAPSAGSARPPVPVQRNPSGPPMPTPARTTTAVSNVTAHGTSSRGSSGSGSTGDPPPAYDSGEPPPEYTAVAKGQFDPRSLTDFQLDELTHRLIGRITRLIRTELRLDRERIGKLRDPRR
ncbi:hypothetical protein [Streptomyces sp. Qhu-G9]|uniref:hypothetical protein n=1 Tax=Streptomyces sp. Qhu-G9 TaxID=3452799 RepID=UPI0022ABFBE5|nr:hypothetical protein [Streptomyces aurantiacus]